MLPGHSLQEAGFVAGQLARIQPDGSMVGERGVEDAGIDVITARIAVGAVRVMQIEGLEDWEAEEAAKRAASFEQAEPRIAAKAEAERQRHVALGWITEDGEPGPNAPQHEEDEDEEEA